MKPREWILKNRRQVIAGIVMALCMAAMLALPFRVLREQGRLLILVGVFCFCAHTLYKRWWVPLIAFLLAIVVCTYAVGGDLIAYEIVSETPLQQLPELDVSVIPGGELLQWSVAVEQGSRSVVKTSKVIVCFYMPGDGPCVVAAHPCGREAGDTPDISPNSEALVSGSSRPASVLADCEHGVVFAGLRCPDPDRKALPLAGAEDVKVGEEAVICTLSKGDIPVKVMGFSMMNDAHLLVLQRFDKDAEVGAGMSGSPVIQDGKIIAFLHSVTRFHRGPRFVMARPALEVYDALQEYLEP